MGLGRGPLKAMQEAVLLGLPVAAAEPARRAPGAAGRRCGGRTGKGGTPGRARPASDRCATAGDPPCAATIATAVAQPAMAAAPASTKTPVRKRTSSSQA